jgi:hypothetical protein
MRFVETVCPARSEADRKQGRSDREDRADRLKCRVKVESDATEQKRSGNSGDGSLGPRHTVPGAAGVRGVAGNPPRSNGERETTDEGGAPAWGKSFSPTPPRSKN